MGVELQSGWLIEFKVYSSQCVYLWQLLWDNFAERMFSLCGQFKKEIRSGVKLLWQATNNIQSRRTERMQFACCFSFLKALKHSL